MKLLFRSIVFIFLCAIFALWLSPVDQDRAADSVIQKQWEKSMHAGSMDTPQERERMNQPGCAHCHTAQGYWREILAGKKSKAPYENASGITCEACHDTEKMSSGDAALRAGGPDKACTGCHDILVQNDDKGFSSCLQGTMLRGEGGAEFEGFAYRTATHSQVENNCVGCHMADSPAGEEQFLLGGHVFRVISKGGEPRLFNDAGCMECHIKISLAGIDKSQTEVRELMQELKRLLPKQEDGEPKFPEDPALSKIQSKASFNYFYILKDGTWGIHNPIYIRQLLWSSLEALEADENSGLIPKGAGSFVFQKDDINRGRAITVYSYLPSDYGDNSPVLFVMHGNSRTAENYRNAWLEIAEKNHALLLVPHFSRENGFPEDDQYNMGNMFNMDREENLLSPNPENEWSYSLIDPIFDFVVERMRNTSKGYLIYGHSAGSQFLHRFLFFKPDAKVQKAVCANAGWYTMPDFQQIFPYGLKETQCSDDALRKLFTKKVTVLLGDQDTDPNHSSLRRTPQAMLQGSHRFERGHTFYKACKETAAALGVPFNWKLKIAPGIAHSNRDMAPFAAEVLFGDSPQD